MANPCENWILRQQTFFFGVTVKQKEVKLNLDAGWTRDNKKCV